MRIGEFASMQATSIDTIRHYMDLGLVVPEKQGTYYYFDERCARDYNRVIEMKDMGFSLMEIRNIMLISRFSKMASGMEIEHYQDFFEDKKAELIRQRDELTEKIDQLTEKIEALNLEKVEKLHSIGVRLDLLGVLSCPICGKDLSLAEAQIANNAIQTGRLTCACDYELVVEDGILIDKSSMKKTTEYDEAYFIRYVKQNSVEYLDNIYRAMEWGYRHIDESLVENKQVLELGVGNGIFLSHIIKALPHTTRYIAVDYDLNRLQYLKKMLERITFDAQVLFICADFRKIPLKKESVGFVIDFYGSTSFHMNTPDFLHALVSPLYAKRCGIMGIFMCFDKFKKTSKIHEASRRLFKRETIKQALNDMGFKSKLDTFISHQAEADNSDDLFELTNRIDNYGFYGYRRL